MSRALHKTVDWSQISESAFDQQRFCGVTWLHPPTYPPSLLVTLCVCVCVCDEYNMMTLMIIFEVLMYTFLLILYSMMCWPLSVRYSAIETTDIIIVTSRFCFFVCLGFKSLLCLDIVACALKCVSHNHGQTALLQYWLKYWNTGCKDTSLETGTIFVCIYTWAAVCGNNYGHFRFISSVLLQLLAACNMQCTTFCTFSGAREAWLQGLLGRGG